VYIYLLAGNKQFKVQQKMTDAEIILESKAPVQRTLAIIKPEALPYADEIEDKIKDDNYTIIQVQKP
jgi:hypothetical protein